jgi:hypothetical protein
MRLVALALLVLLAATAAEAGAQTTHGDTLRELRGSTPRSDGVGELLVPQRRAISTVGCGVELSADDTEHAVTEGPQVRVVYARPHDVPSRYATVKDNLHVAAARISTILAEASGGTLDVRWDAGTPCGPDTLDITSIVLPHAAAHYNPPGGTAESFSTIEKDA